MEPNDCTPYFLKKKTRDWIVWKRRWKWALIRTRFQLFRLEANQGKYRYLIYCEGEDLKIAFRVYVEARKRLVISNAERGEGFIKVQVKPIDANVEVAPKNQWNNRSREHPKIEKHRSIIYHSFPSRKWIHPIFADITPTHSHHLKNEMPIKLREMQIKAKKL